MIVTQFMGDGDRYTINWGRNQQGQLGKGFFSTRERQAPIFVGDPPRDFDLSHGSAKLIKADGTFWVTGIVGMTIGDGATTNTLGVWTQVGAATDWAKVKGVYATHYLIKEDGSLYGWGENSDMELGDGSAVDRTTIQFLSAGPWLDVDAQFRGGVGIKQDGSLWAWGRGTVASGRAVGDGANVDRASPVRIGLANNWVKVGMCGDCRFALNSSGQLFSWGRQNAGEAGVGLGIAGVRIPTLQLISGTYQDFDANYLAVAAVRTNGTMWEWGHTNHPGGSVFTDVPVQRGTDNDWKTAVVGVNSQSVDLFAAGGLKTDDTFHIWGYQFYNQLSSFPTLPLGTARDPAVLADGLQTTQWEKVRLAESHGMGLIK